ncbi:hypothetical protein K7432_013082 [Basidiobolus ranarum]|uniref:Uncharacterized protein n=1 Tax=Basidiobolus ranarum TaxID=34480 RepID=A0ABR2WJT3_9FUNG
MGSTEPHICSGAVKVFSDRVKFSHVTIASLAETPFITLQNHDNRLYAQNQGVDLLEFIQDPISRDKALLKLPCYEGPVQFEFNLEVTLADFKILALVQCPTASAAVKLLTNIEPKSDKIYEHGDIFIVDTLPINVASTFQWTWKWSRSRHYESTSKGLRGNFMFVIFDTNTNTYEEQFHFDLWMDTHGAFSASNLLQLQRVDSSESNYSSRTHMSSCIGETSLEKRKSDRLSPLTSKINSFQWDLKTSPSEEIEQFMLEKELPQPGKEEETISPSKMASTHKRERSEPFNIDIVDSPLLRYKIQQSEKKVATFKYEIKKLMKAIATYDEVCQQLIRVSGSLLGTIKSIKSLEPILKFIDPVFYQMLKDREVLQKQMRILIFYPLQRIYEKDIKLVDHKTKEFMREADEFYHVEAKHLSMKNDRDKSRKQVSSDQKYENKRSLFEQKILEFYTYIHELTEGPKEEELMLCFANFGQKCFDHIRRANSIAGEYKEELSDIESYLNKQSAIATEQRRLMEEKSEQIGKLISGPRASENLDVPAKSENSRNFVSLVRSKSSAFRDKLSNRIGGIRDMSAFNAEQVSSAGRHKEGVLYSPNRQRTPNLESSWQSNWCVISKGQFSEIINWKKKPDAHKASISLKLSSVRQVPDAERRFCFELVTLQERRLYQALSYEDMADWINVLKNAIESQLNGTGSSPDLRALAISSDNESTRKKSEDFSDEYQESSLISIFRADPSNHCCADCASKNPEWCSINLGILLCIECSGVHRSLGTHISKIRSLTLDNSFTPDLVDMVKKIGNELSNSIWEATLSRDSVNKQGRAKPTNNDSRDVKAAFIKAKYVERSFLDYSVMFSQEPSSFKAASTSCLLQPGEDPFQTYATELLFKAIESNDIQEVVRAFALGADLNYRKLRNCPELTAKMTYAAFLETPVEDEGVTPLQLALSTPLNLHTIADLPLGTHQGRNEAAPITEFNIQVNNESLERTFPTFPIAEFLIQNGADINQCVPQSGFTLLHTATIRGNPGAVKYLLSKGSNPKILDHYGKTPYVWAVLTGDLCGQILRDALARSSQSNTNGVSAADKQIYQNPSPSTYSVQLENQSLTDNVSVSPPSKLLSSKLETMGVARLFK